MKIPKLITNPRIATALVVLCLVAPFGARAEFWVGGALGNWNVGANWNNGTVPNGNIGEVINGTAMVSNTVPNVTEAWVGNNGVAGNIIVTNGGTLTVNNWLVIGRMFQSASVTPFSRLTIHNGTVNKSGDGFIVGDNFGGMASEGELTVSGTSTLNVSGGWFGIGNGNGSKGTVTFKDSAVVNCNFQDFNVGDYGASQGFAYVQDNASLTVRRFWVGKTDSSFGRLLQTGGAIIGATGGNEWCIGGENGAASGSYGFYGLSGGSLSNPNNFQIGRNGQGVIYQSGGSITASSWTALGRFPSGVGVIWVSGGLFSHTGTGTQLIVGENGRGQFDLTAGTLDCNLRLRLGNPGGLGIVNLNGGLTTVPGVEVAGGVGFLNFNGGTIFAKGSSPTFMGGLTEAVVYGGNAIIDVSTNDISISQALLAPSGNGVQSIPIPDGGAGYLAPPIVQIDGSGSGSGATAIARINPATGVLTNILITCSGYGYGATPNVTLLGGGATTPATLGTPVLASASAGGLVKNGTGTLTLTGANTYSGATAVNAGRLAARTDSSVSGSASVAAGAALSVTIASAGSQLGQSSLSLGASTLEFDLGSFGNPSLAPINVSGALAVNGAVTVNVATAVPQVGQFPLIAYGSRTGSGSFVIGSLPSGVTANLATNGNTIALNVTAVAAPRWDGQVAGGVWDIGTTTNWIEISTLLPTTYAQGNAVLFTDDALGTTSVNLGVQVNPAKVTVNNNTLSYSISGSGRISGATGLTKQGAGGLALNTQNDYTGATRLEGGTVVVTNLANGGLPSPIGSSSSAAANLVLANATLRYGGPAVAINRGYSIQNTNSAIDTANDLSLSGPVTAGAGSAFVKLGPAKLTYAGAGVRELSGGAFPGYRVESGTVVFDGTSGAQTNHSQNELWVGNTTNGPASLVLSNSILNVDSWIAVGRGNGTAGYHSTATLYNSRLRSGNFSMGFDAGVGGHLASQTLSLRGTSTLTNAADMNLGESSGSTTSILLYDNSVLFSDWRVHLGWHSGGTAFMTLSNSSIVNVDAWFSVGHEGGTGTLTVRDNSTVNVLWDMNITDVDTGSATLNIHDNAVVRANNFFVGKGVGSTGIVNQDSGSAVGRLADGNEFQIGFHGQGDWNLSGGSIIAPNHWFIVGRWSDGPGTFTMTGGTVIHGTNIPGRLLRVGEDGTGTLHLNAGTIDTACNEITIGWNASGNGTLNLNGGTLRARRIIGGAGTSTLNFNGGVLRVGANPNANFMTGLGTANVMAGGAIIDTGTNVINVNQALGDGGGGGGLTKNGTGTLRLNGANAYTGVTLVSAGTLGGNGSFAGPVSVAAGAVLSPGLSIGSLTVNANLALAGSSTTVMELSKVASTNDFVTAVNLGYGGTLVLRNVGGPLAVNDTFKLFDATSYSGSFSGLVSYTPGQTVAWNTSNLTVDGTVRVVNVVAVPVTLTTVAAGGNLNLSWPPDQLGWRLETQTNPLSVGISNNWVTVPGSTEVTAVSVPIVPGNPTAFFRLIFP